MTGFFNGLVPQPPFPWFSHAWDRFQAQRQTAQLPHAFLLCGPDGCGGVDFARALAQSLLCLAGDGAKNCGRCKSCRLLAADSHPDLVLIQPEEKSQFIKVEAIRATGEFVAKTAQQGGLKVVIICPAENMNTNASNALLKNLEEPTEHTVFLLVSYDPARLLATIKSRCSIWKWSIPSTPEADAWLARNRVNGGDQKLQRTGGRPLQTLLWDEQDLFAKSEKAEQVLAEYVAGQQSLTACAKALTAFDPVWLLDLWLRWLQRVAVSLSVEQTTDLRTLYALYDKLIERKQQLLRGFNPNAQLLVEDLLILFRADRRLAQKLADF